MEKPEAPRRAEAPPAQFQFVQEQSGPAPKRGSGRSSSCLTVGLIVIIVMAVMAGGLVAFTMLARSGLHLGQGVGVVEIYGVITDAEPVLRTLTQFREDEDIKAVIIRVDSPGGGVAATQEIYKEIQRTNSEKKVIVSMGSVAASGGLYLAAAADKIMANPATVTGSIGVIMQSFNVEDILGKIGLKPVVIKSGKYKDMGSFSRPMTDEERALLQGVVDELHLQFVRDLAEGRHLDRQLVADLADGRIFTGEKAKELGLIDELGNFEDAITLAQKLAGLEERPNLIYPRREQPWWRDFLGGESPLQFLPEWARQPVTFQYLYLPGV